MLGERGGTVSTQVTMENGTKAETVKPRRGRKAVPEAAALPRPGARETAPEACGDTLPEYPVGPG